MQVQTNLASTGNLANGAELSGVLDALSRAGAPPIGEVPAALAPLVPLLETLKARLSRADAATRQEALRQLSQFRSRLSIFATALNRGEAILHGYSRLAGTRPAEYGPAGLGTIQREPSILNVDC